MNKYYKRYLDEWGNYKTDEWKTKGLLREEIEDIIYLGNFSKEELIKIKNKLKERAFK